MCVCVCVCGWVCGSTHPHTRRALREQEAEQRRVTALKAKTDQRIRDMEVGVCGCVGVWVCEWVMALKAKTDQRIRGSEIWRSRRA